ncbi:MAG: hypothetical protein J1F67_09020 [Muribaculaceae bacterium]|nr:hypothetical protein [Muribaculaceae bacterium]
MKTTDFNKKEIDSKELADIKTISNVSLSELAVRNESNLLIFPDSFTEYDENFGKKTICHILDDKFLVTNSIVGFVGKGKSHLSIHSRFSNGIKDYFLHYMIGKLAGINLLNLNHTTDEEDIFNFLIYLFPQFLKRALKQGIYKQYINKDYNDTCVRGPINISRHIHTNLPFNGKIAYSKREYNYDNNITQLIRHTIEFIRKIPIGNEILNFDYEIKQNVNQIMTVTPKYVSRDLNSVINRNLRPVNHPYYSEYTTLQKLCLQILRYEELKYGNNNNEIYGLLIDAAWLWEEYLGIILYPHFYHYRKNKGTRLNLFENNFQQIIPDYLSMDKRIVADAKYIPLDKEHEYGEEKATAVYYKTITYMYRFCSDIGFLLYPKSNNNFNPIIYNIKTEKDGINGGKIIKLGLQIPDVSKCNCFAEFAELMGQNEKDFISKYEHIN